MSLYTVLLHDLDLWSYLQLHEVDAALHLSHQPESHRTLHVQAEALAYRLCCTVLHQASWPAVACIMVETAIVCDKSVRCSSRSNRSADSGVSNRAAAVLVTAHFAQAAYNSR
jgi:hypothetical protein